MMRKAYASKKIKAQLSKMELIIFDESGSPNGASFDQKVMEIDPENNSLS